MKYLLFAFYLLLTVQMLAQNSDLYIPLNIQNSYKNKTRSMDGTPGSAYWQNRSDYKINAQLLPDSSYLIGDETITYYNNSNDTLNMIVIRLYQDILKTGASRDWYVGNKGLSKGVDLKYLIVKNDTLDVSESSKEIIRTSTNLIVKLAEPIAPKSTTNIKVGWSFNISEKLKIRMGNYGNGNFYIAYWYPEIAVYDDIDGWDRNEYQGMVEFYNDFSTFEVSLIIPKGFVAWATGNLQNAKNVLRKDINEKYERAKMSDETIKIISQNDYKIGSVTSEQKINTWKFKAKNVPSFAFVISKNSNWDGASIEVDSLTKRRVLTDVVYPDSTIHYDKAVQYSRTIIDYMSNQLPGYPYPYSHATSFCNGTASGGMESPMMANNGAPKILGRHVGLIFHELAHNYFPFFMGTNERKYAWMDEGWASFLPKVIVNEKDIDYDYLNRVISGYSKSAGPESELPPIVPSYSYKGKSLRTGFYSRPASAYFELYYFLGDELFKKALREYIHRWNGKHPIPHDFFFTFNHVVGEDLSWFWKPWFYEFGYPDLSISDAELNDDILNVSIAKIGNIPTRVFVTLVFEDNTKKTIEKSVRVWKDGSKHLKFDLNIEKKIKSIQVGNKYIPDAVKENNIFEF